MRLAYAGIGSRNTPANILGLMRTYATRLAKAHWTVHTGGADGADSQFEFAAKQAGGGISLWLPFYGFNKRSGLSYIAATQPTLEALELMEGFLDEGHWTNMREAYLRKCVEKVWTVRLRPNRRGEPSYCPAHLLHARNAHQILGKDLRSPVDFVLCWCPVRDGKPQGGTATGIKLADENGISVHNMWFASVRRRLHDDLCAHYEQTGHEEYERQTTHQAS